jgi:DNA helicase-2/ATP-dependent DNA helicase PcrA
MSKLRNSSALEGLDPEQSKAASAISGPVAIVAGAGTGKTRTITHRIAYACETGEWNPKQVLAVTFTAKAAAEMRERLASLGVNGVNVHTFHAAALKQMQYYWPQVIGTSCPKLETNKLVHILDAAKSLDIELTKSEAMLVADEIGWAKVSLVAATEYESTVEMMDHDVFSAVRPHEIARLYTEYDNIKSDRGMVDFEDVLLVMIHLISTKPAVAKEIHQTYQHIIVDEYQDVSPLQQQLLKCWLGNSRELCVVGDPSQTIYSFTGATPTYLLYFEQHWKPKTTSQAKPRKIDLIRDYRSSPQIVDVANQILKLRGKAGFEPLQLVSQLEDQRIPVEYFTYADDPT